MKTFTNIILESKISEEMKFVDPCKNSVWNYVAGYTVVQINKMLRDDKMTSKLKELVTNIDSAMTVVDNMKVYRTVEWDYLQNIYKINPKNLDSCIGYEFETKAYTSTTKTRQNVWSSIWMQGEAFMEIDVNGLKGIIVNDMFDRNDIDCYEQNEVILQRNFKFKITDYSMMDVKGNTNYKNNKNIIHFLKIEAYV